MALLGQVQVALTFVGSTYPRLDQTILDPRSTWADAAEYDATAKKLVQLFIANFAQFEAHVDEGVLQAAPAPVAA